MALTEQIGRLEQTRERQIAPVIIQRLVKLADFGFINVTGFALFILLGVHRDPYRLTVIAFTVPFMAYLVLFGLRSAWLYTIRGLSQPATSVLASWSVAAITGFIMYHYVDRLLFPVDASWLRLWLLTSFVYFAAVRLPLAGWVAARARAGCFRQRIAIVGSDTHAAEAVDLLRQTADNSFEIVGLYDDRNDPDRTVAIPGYRKIGSITDLAEHTRQDRIDHIIVTIPPKAESRLLQMLKTLWVLPVDIRIAGHTSKLRLAPGSYSYLGQLPLLSVFNRPLESWAAFVKTAFDRVVAAMCIVVFAPVMIATAVAIRLESKGPVIFRQKRYGFNNELIEVYKFRSMYTDRCDANATRLVTRDDPRVTRVGRFIRKTSLDELPQLFNVLKGELSLVGPRPHATQAKAENQLYEEVVEGYFARHKIKPGITGWAQINGWRGETDTADKIANRVKYDLEYIDRWSILFDIYILAMTPVSLVARNDNAF